VDPFLTETIASPRSVSFDDTFEAAFPQLVRVLTVACGDREVAIASSTEAFERAFVRWRRVSRLDEPSSWVRREAIRRARDAIGSGPATTSDDPLLVAIAALPFDARAVFALHEVGDLGTTAIARGVGLGEETARSQLDEGREHVRAAWDPGDHEFDHVVRSYLRQVVHGPSDPAGELNRLRPRFTRARRRRTARFGLAAAVAAAFAFVAVSSLRHDQPAVATRADVTTIHVTTTEAEPPAPPDAALNPPMTHVPWAAPNNVVAPPDGVISRSVPLTAPGGIVVVRVDGSDVMLVMATPAPGWAVAETRTDGGRVGVRFRLDGTPDVSKVVARVENGQFIGEVG
jgi:DNA-directed RNA polymerase specialized sigma24 family protein